jgi:hypothetical protein
MLTEDERDTAYTNGHQRAWLSMMNECIRQLGYEHAEVIQTRWIRERAELVLTLRAICEDFGDNDWPDDLNLADVMNKHLAKYLHE